jgi:hypothetical protein
MDFNMFNLIAQIVLVIASIFLAFQNLYVHKSNKMLQEAIQLLENDVKDKEMVIRAFTNHVQETHGSDSTDQQQ